MPLPDRGNEPLDKPLPGRGAPGRPIPNVPGGRVPWRPTLEIEPADGQVEPQQLRPSNTTPNISEALEARIKDPLWYLAMQWRTGEFDGESGGRPAQAEVVWEAAAPTTIQRGEQSVPIDLNVPLEVALEREESGGAPAWSSDRLEYRTVIAVHGAQLVASGYTGHGIEWFDFDLNADARTTKLSAASTNRVLPTNLRFRGLPHPRWWRLDDADADVALMSATLPNFLAMLLPEFLLIDSNNWFVLPLEQQVGTLRRITKLTMVDSFGVVTEIGPVLNSWGSQGWEVFTQAPAAAAPTVLDGSYLYVPHRAAHVVDSDPIEDIDLLRDENSNVVWAIEQRYTAADGRVVNRGDEEARVSSTPSGLADPNTLDAARQAMPVYRLASELPRHWIPYLPRRFPGGGPLQAQIYLRRGRTDERASRASPQYRSRLLAESWRLFEEEIPRTGLRLQRRWRFARGVDGAEYFWIGRVKDIGRDERTANLNFDFLLRGGR